LHTSTPWAFSESVDLDEWLPAITQGETPDSGQDGKPIICAFAEGADPRPENMEFILKAVNNHERLISVLKDVRATLPAGHTSLGYIDDALKRAE